MFFSRALRFNPNRLYSLATGTIVGTSAAVLFYFGTHSVKLEGRNTAYYRLDEVKRHQDKNSGIWVTYKDAVYDITEFVEGHPGGDKILMAAGGAVDPFWSVYTIHNNPQVREILEKYRIGSIHPEDLKSTTTTSANDSIVVNDPFVNDPPRSPLLLTRSAKPFNAETPLAILGDHFITPNEIFYKRNHLPVPQVSSPSEFTLEISGIGVDRPVKFTVDDLNRMPHTDLMVTLQCAGNRRKEMYAAGEVQGLAWEGGAIGNAVWTGVFLKDLLRHAAVEIDDKSVSHIQFEGLDGYGASVPVSKVSSAGGDVLLALKMNGVDLPRDHGFPLRILIPGHVAARSVKWVNKIVLADHESTSHWQRKDYKGFSPSSNWDNLQWECAQSIQELPVQSGILNPSNGASVEVDNGTVPVRGYAWSGGGRSIIRVDVSPDGGKSWHVASIDQQPPNPAPNRVWAWTHWEVDLPIPKDVDHMDLVCKAVDSSYNVQPETVNGIYNKRGVLSNAWNRISLKII